MKLNFGVLLFFLLSNLACQKANRFDCIKRTGKIITENRTLSVFDVIDVRSNIHTFLVQDTVCFTEVKAGSNLIEKIETYVEGSTLIIQNINRCNYTRSYKHPIEVYVHFKKLNELIYKGTGPIKSLNTIVNERFTFNSWDGTDTVSLTLDVPLVNANIHTGVADLIVTGQCSQLYAYAQGSGVFRMQDFKCKNIYSNNLSSSDHYFNVENKLEALVQYVGNTYYKGSPTEIIKTENNKGMLIQMQ